MSRECIKCYIYGIGMEYNRLSSYLEAYQNQVEILALVTTEPQKVTQMDGKEIIRPCEMKVDQLDYVIVAMEQYKEVFQILDGMGLSEKIIRSNVFTMPNFNLKEYLKLKISRPSILANTCLGGGVLYNKLGLKILSPTINALCKNYIKFLQNYNYYLCKDIVGGKNDFSGECLYLEYQLAPKGMLDPLVYWQFTHEVSENSEIEKWNRRRCLINFKNIIALMTITTEEDAYKFDELPIKRKLGFYYKDLNLKSVIFTPEWDDKKVEYRYQYYKFINQYYGRTIGNVGRINWVKFLNGDDNFLRF